MLEGKILGYRTNIAQLSLRILLPQAFDQGRGLRQDLVFDFERYPG